METNELVRKNVCAAAAGAWVAAIVGLIWMTLGWGLWLLILYAKPGCLLSLWGGGELNWDQVQLMCIGFFGLFKLIIFALVLTAICLTIWARGLSKGE